MNRYRHIATKITVSPGKDALILNGEVRSHRPRVSVTPGFIFCGLGGRRLGYAYRVGTGKGFPQATIEFLVQLLFGLCLFLLVVLVNVTAHRAFSWVIDITVRAVFRSSSEAGRVLRTHHPMLGDFPGSDGRAQSAPAPMNSIELALRAANT
ncbi:hypothetical protein [Nitrobacter sp. 62-13]|uniref:hypothetical protein n=1 Tax=Nitrobacter sp. 62-13 TaxID=1895797 RepID=UPI0025DF2A5F|nr:hypothetical protein [Nitrobacter sp. 62-13]